MTRSRSSQSSSPPEYIPTSSLFIAVLAVILLVGAFSIYNRVPVVGPFFSGMGIAGGVGMLVMALTGYDFSTFKGTCPYCGAAVKIMAGTYGQACLKCKNPILIRARNFHQVKYVTCPINPKAVLQGITLIQYAVIPALLLPIAAGAGLFIGFLSASMAAFKILTLLCTLGSIGLNLAGMAQCLNIPDRPPLKSFVHAALIANGIAIAMVLIATLGGGALMSSAGFNGVLSLIAAAGQWSFATFLIQVVQLLQRPDIAQSLSEHRGLIVAAGIGTFLLPMLPSWLPSDSMTAAIVICALSSFSGYIGSLKAMKEHLLKCPQ